MEIPYFLHFIQVPRILKWLLDCLKFVYPWIINIYVCFMHFYATTTSLHFSTAKISSQQVHHSMSLNLKFLNYNYNYKQFVWTRWNWFLDTFQLSWSNDVWCTIFHKSKHRTTVLFPSCVWYILCSTGKTTEISIHHPLLPAQCWATVLEVLKI